jgi:hypothetical protein
MNGFDAYTHAGAALLGTPATYAMKNAADIVSNPMAIAETRRLPRFGRTSVARSWFDCLRMFSLWQAILGPEINGVSSIPMKWIRLFGYL